MSANPVIQAVRTGATGNRPLRSVAPGTEDGTNILQVAPLGMTGSNGSATFTRPNDTNPYAANDAVANSTSAPTIIEFSAIVHEAVISAAGWGPGGYITKVWFNTTQATCTARFRLWLFWYASTTPTNDNAAFLLTLGNANSCLGYIDLPACSPGTGVAWALNKADVLEFVTSGLGTSLYGILQTLDAFTPDAQQAFNIFLGVERG